MCNVHEIYADFYRIEQQMDLHSPLNEKRYMFRTYLIFSLWEECHCIIPEDPVAQESLKWYVMDLCYSNWYAFKGKEYEIMVRILSSLLHESDPFLFEFHGLFSVRDSFASDLIYRIWEENDSIVSGDDQYGGYLKTLVVKGIIG